jgi:hypothetical protein
MKPTGRLVALALSAAVAVTACTGDEGGDGPADEGDGGTGQPTETLSVAPGAAIYRYANAGLVVTLDLDAGTLEVENGTGRELPRPDVYALAAADGAQIDGRVIGASPIPAGGTATFDVELAGIEPDDIGLVVLLMGKDNYGAFVRQ